MTNWAHNTLKVTGPEDEVAKFKQTCIRVVYEGERAQLDFDAVMPMPNDIKNSEPSSEVDETLLALGRRDMLKSTGSFLADKHLKGCCVSREALAKAEEAVELYEEHGHYNWYTWAFANWGTKWNAVRFGVDVDAPGRYVCRFETVWNPPFSILKKLGEMFPTLDFLLTGGDPEADRGFEARSQHGEFELVYDHEPLVWGDASAAARLSRRHLA